MYIFIFHSYIPIYRFIIYIHTSEILYAIVLQALSMLDYSRLVLTGCFPASYENSKIKLPTKLQDI